MKKMQQICVVCGSPAFKENLCEKCFLERHNLYEVPEKIKLNRCPNCGSYYDKHVKNDLESILKNKIVSKNIVTKKSVKTLRGFAIFLCSGYIKPSRKIKKEEKKSVLIIENKKCDSCVKMLSGYYQAVFQIRGGDSERIMKRIISNAGKMITEKTKHGYDIKFIDKKNAARIAGLLKGFAIKKTYKLITEKKGKKIYRDYYSIR